MASHLFFSILLSTCAIVVAVALLHASANGSGTAQAYNVTAIRACSPDNVNYALPFCNTSLSIDDRVADLVSRLEPEEKIPLMIARLYANVTRLGIPSYDWGGNCIHGVESMCVNGSCPTSFPAPNALGASWNLTNVQLMGAIIGWELRALWRAGSREYQSTGEGGNHIGLDCWSPTINIARDPRWGRSMEVPSEDPYLAGQYGVAYTRGNQYGSDLLPFKTDPRYLQTIVTLKHFAAYSLENVTAEGITRYNFDAIVNQHDLMETYFPAMRAAVVEGGALGVMCSYNAVNGAPSCANADLLNATLRNAWGFEGYVTSDTEAIEDIYVHHNYTNTSTAAAAAALNAGCDIESSGGIGDYYLSMLNATALNLTTMHAIDVALSRAFKLKFQLGLFDPIEEQPYWNVPLADVGTAESQALSYLMSQESMVLLKNDGNTLPFLPSANATIAVIGPNANATINMVGNYFGELCPNDSFDCIVSPVQAITERLNQTGGTTLYESGCGVVGNDTSGFLPALFAAKAADYVVLVLGLSLEVEGESHDRVNITLPGVQEQLADLIMAVGKPTVVVLINGGMIAMPNVKDKADSIIEAFYPGVQGGKAIASVIFGDYNPGGKLAVTIYNDTFIEDIKMTDMNVTTWPGRGYRYLTQVPLWPAFYGLSYTTFTMDVAPLLNMTFQTVGSSTSPLTSYNFTIEVGNQGSVDGDEVIFAFARPIDFDNYTIFNPFSPPFKKLIKFQRVHVAAGSSTSFEFEVDATDFTFVDAGGNLVSTPGSFELLFTNGVYLEATVAVQINGDTQIIDAFPY